MDKDFKFPFYIKAPVIFMGFMALIYMLDAAQVIILPLLFSVIAAIILHPVVNFFVRKKINKVVSIIITLTFTIIIIAAFGILLFSQAIRFSESLPQLIDKLIEMSNNVISALSRYFDISPQKISLWLKNAEVEMINNSGTAIGQTIVTLGGLLVLFFLIPVYVFMILFYQPLLIEFFQKLFGTKNRVEVSEIIAQIKNLIQRYLIGLLIETAIIAALYSIGLLVMGIEYAIVLGVIGAFLNLIPYIGSWIAAALPMIIAVLTKTSPWFAILVLGMYLIIQLFDNNYIVPKFVGSKVRINALITIISVIAFGTLWGIPGMLIAIPLTAIIKLIFDHIEPLKSLGFLMGDTMPALVIFKIKKKNK